jgi:tetratricopeptide (TPR) repeat protein
MRSRSRDSRLRRLIKRAQALGEEGHADHAIRLLRGALERDRESAELRLALGIELMEDSAEEESVLHLERAAVLSQNDPAMLFRVASALQGAGAFKHAVRAAQRVYELTEKDFSNFVFAVDLQHLAGLLAREAGDHESAELALRAAFEAEPNTLNHGRWLAGLLIDQDRFDEALDVVQVALEHRPGDENLIEMRDWLEDELEP